MGFKATRTSSPTAPVLDPFNGDVIIGGGVASAPTTGAELLDLIRRWTQSQPDLSGKKVTVEVTEGKAVVVVKKVEKVNQTSQIVDDVVATFIAYKSGAGGTPISLAGMPGEGAVISCSDLGVWLVAGSWNSSVKSAPSPDGETFSVADLSTQLTGFSAKAAGNGFFGIAQTLAFANVFVSSPDGVNYTEYTRSSTLGALGFQVYAFANGKYYYSDGGSLYRSLDLTTWSPVLLQYDEGANEKKEIIGISAHDGKLYAYGRWSRTDNSGRIAALYVSSDDGLTWATKKMPGIYEGQITSFAVGAGTMLAVSWGGVGYHSEDNGVTWTQYSPPDGGVVWAGDRFFALKTSYSDYRCYTSADGLTWGEIALPSWIPTPSGQFGTNGSVVCINSKASPSKLAFLVNGEWSTTAAGSAIAASYEDIASANADGGPVSFFWSAGLDPAYLTAPVDMTYPPYPPHGYVQGVFDNWPVPYGYFGFGVVGQFPYFVLSQNGQYFNWYTFSWQSAFTSQCRHGIPPNQGDGGFFNALAYAFSGREAIWGGVVGPQFFFVTVYTEWGTQLATELVMVSSSSPAFIQLQSAGQYLNFATGALQATATDQTWLKPVGPMQSFGNATDAWNIYIADMPKYSAGLEPYTPPTTTAPVYGGNGGGGDWVSGPGGYSAAPSSPFTFLAAGGMSIFTAPPTPREFRAGFSEYTAPPLPFTTRGGFMEQTSPTTARVANSAATLHMGIPITVEG